MNPRNWLMAIAVATLAPMVDLPAGPSAFAGPEAAPAVSTEQALRGNLDKSLGGFNKGDFETYLHDVDGRLTYNQLHVERSRLLEINRELKSSFPNLKMAYKEIRINPIAAEEATATTVAEFSGQTSNYDGSGLPASYREVGQVTAFYRKDRERWQTNQLQVAWNDSFIDIGREFGVMGFTGLPTLVGVGQPYRLRLFSGDDATPGVGTTFAYAAVPLASVIDKAGAEEVFKALKFAPIDKAGIDVELRAPKREGTYAHVLVVNKAWRLGNNESLLGQKIYTRLVRVE